MCATLLFPFSGTTKASVEVSWQSLEKEQVSSGTSGAAQTSQRLPELDDNRISCSLRKHGKCSSHVISLFLFQLRKFQDALRTLWVSLRLQPPCQGKPSLWVPVPDVWMIPSRLFTVFSRCRLSNQFLFSSPEVHFQFLCFHFIFTFWFLSSQVL